KGVRFMWSDPLHETWLPKNQAYETLAKAASGDLVLFCGADVRFETDSITKIVNYNLSKGLKMTTVLPQRVYIQKPQIIQPMRYWWELVLPRFWMKQPPSISTCWIIDR